MRSRVRAGGRAGVRASALPGRYNARFSMVSMVDKFSLQKVRRILPLAEKHHVPVTFRAAGGLFPARAYARTHAPQRNARIAHARTHSVHTHVLDIRGMDGYVAVGPSHNYIGHNYTARAGTSLSGQAVTDSVMVKLSHNGRHWRRLFFIFFIAINVAARIAMLPCCTDARTHGRTGGRAQDRHL